MNPHGDTELYSAPCQVAAEPDDKSHPPPPCPASSHQDAGQNLLPLPCSDHSASEPGFILRSVLEARPPVPPAVSLPDPVADPASCHVSVIIPSPDRRPSPAAPQCSEDTCPDLECSICFSEFNNVFRCPKMLHCRHTFCLECLARINVKSVEPSAVQCPLCRGLTSLPSLGLPRLPTDSDVLSYLPAAMQRVYSIRFLRHKGKLQVKRSSESQRWWGQRPLRSANRSLDVGLPSPPVGRHEGTSGVGGALFRLTGRPACRAFLLTSVVMMMLLLTGIIICLVLLKNRPN